MNLSIFSTVKQGPKRRAVTFRQLLPLWEFTVPNPAERSNPDEWRQRVVGNQALLPLSVLLEARYNDVVVGGAAYELFPVSRCALLTYISTLPRWQGHGIARALLRRIGRELKEREYRLLLEECHNPWLVSADGDSMPPKTRLQVMKKLGAMLCPFSYVQPPLSAGKEPIRSFHLLCFPELTGLTPDTVEKRFVCRFLVEFYTVLGVSLPMSNAEMQQMISQIEATAGPYLHLVSP